MKIWQADFYSRPIQDTLGQTLWELLITQKEGNLVYTEKCPQSMVNSDWLVSQLVTAAKGNLPDVIQVFRPQCLGLFTLACEKLKIILEATRRTEALKRELEKLSQQYNYNLVKLESPPPLPLPENLIGQEWRFASIKAGDIVDNFSDRPIPFLQMPQDFLPLNMAISSTVAIPGVIIYAGKKSLALANWLQQQQPVSLDYISTDLGSAGGLLLEAGLVDRWIIATTEDKEVQPSAQLYNQRKLNSQGLHFLLIQPDDSGITYSGFWLLKNIFDT